MKKFLYLIHLYHCILNIVNMNKVNQMKLWLNKGNFHCSSAFKIPCSGAVNILITEKDDQIILVSEKQNVQILSSFFSFSF